MAAHRTPIANRTALAGIVAGLLLAGTGAVALVDERAVGAAERTLAASGRQAGTPLPDVGSAGRLPRVLLAEGQQYAIASERAGPADRARLLDQADVRLRRAASARPHWGEAAIARAFVTVQRHGGMASTATALEQSYRALPFSRAGGAWRVGVGLQLWPIANEPLRGHIVDEAVWIAGSSPAATDAITDAMRRSPAYAPFMRRWHLYRTSDRSF